MEYLDVDWRTDQFADLLFGDYLNREDKVCMYGAHCHEFAFKDGVFLFCGSIHKRRSSTRPWPPGKTACMRWRSCEGYVFNAHCFVCPTMPRVVFSQMGWDKKTTASLSFTPSYRTRTKPFTPRPYSIHARAPPPPQAYRPVEDRIHLGEVLLEYLEEYNVEFPSQMHLVFFADAVAHVRYVLLPCWERSSGDRGRAEASDEVKRALSSRDRVVDP